MRQYVLFKYILQLPGQEGSVSSELSEQSCSKSHFQLAGMHWPVSHWNCEVEHAPGGQKVQIYKNVHNRHVIYGVNNATLKKHDGQLTQKLQFPKLYK